MKFTVWVCEMVYFAWIVTKSQVVASNGSCLDVLTSLCLISDRLTMNCIYRVCY